MMGGQTNEWVDIQYICIGIQKTIIFQYIFQFLQKHRRTDRPTDGRTDQPTDRRTDKPSYRDAIAASKNNMEHFNAFVMMKYPCKVPKMYLIKKSMKVLKSQFVQYLEGQMDGQIY